MTAPPALLSLSIGNRIGELSAGMDQVEAFLGAWAVDPEDRAQVMIIMDEVGSNIIKGAWPGGGEHRFDVALRIEAGPGGLRLELLATDDGVAFDPTAAGAPDLELDLDEREPGGLGLFMVGEMSDSMEYARVDGRNRLQVTKRLQRAAEQES